MTLAPFSKLAHAGASVAMTSESHASTVPLTSATPRPDRSIALTGVLSTTVPSGSLLASCCGTAPMPSLGRVAAPCAHHFRIKEQALRAQCRQAGLTSANILKTNSNILDDCSDSGARKMPLRNGLKNASTMSGENPLRRHRAREPRAKQQEAKARTSKSKSKSKSTSTSTGTGTSTRTSTSTSTRTNCKESRPRFPPDDYGGSATNRSSPPPSADALPASAMTSMPPIACRSGCRSGRTGPPEL
eukprot:scaffold3504_cov240-Pinguiococcus_pyrenoidosus.AAC.14